MDHSQLRLRNLLGYEYTVVAKQPNSISNPQDCNELVEFYSFLAKIDLYWVIAFGRRQNVRCTIRRAWLKHISLAHTKALIDNFPAPIESCRQGPGHDPDSRPFRHLASPAPKMNFDCIVSAIYGALKRMQAGDGSVVAPAQLAVSPRY